SCQTLGVTKCPPSSCDDCRSLPPGWLGEGRRRHGPPNCRDGCARAYDAPVQAAALLVVPSLVTNVWQFVACSRVRPREIESSRSRFASGFWSLWSSL